MLRAIRRALSRVSSLVAVVRNFPTDILLMQNDDQLSLCLRSISMRVLVYDELGDVALDYDTRTDMVPLCPGRLEKAQVVEALQEAAFFIMDAPAPAPEGRTSRQRVFEGDDGE